tara:strand:- start:638 stop:928 length:291 start_codon:yes stop_codon:yes gene_type:complete
MNLREKLSELEEDAKTHLAQYLNLKRIAKLDELITNDDVVYSDFIDDLASKCLSMIDEEFYYQAVSRPSNDGDTYHDLNMYKRLLLSVVEKIDEEV